jgi:hypothetical protein
LARQIGADLIGVDFSPGGIDHARSRAADIAPEVQVEYVVVDAANTNLPGDSVDGMFCIDAIQSSLTRSACWLKFAECLGPVAEPFSPRGKRLSVWQISQPSSKRPGSWSLASRRSLTG